MTVDCKIILKLLALIRIQEIALNIQKILSHCQRTLLGQIQVIAVITVCIRISVNNDLCKILPVIFLKKNFTIDGKNLLQRLLSFFCQFCFIIIKQNACLQSQSACLCINIHVDIIFCKFLSQSLDHISLYSDDLVDLGLLFL